MYILWYLYKYIFSIDYIWCIVAEKKIEMELFYCGAAFEKKYI